MKPSIPSLRRATAAIAAVLATLSLALRPVAAASAPTELGPNAEQLQTDAADNASKYLGNIYKDEGAGIKLAPPAGSRILNRAGLELVTFVQDEKQWGGDVQSVILKNSTPLKDYMLSRVTELSKNFKAVQVLASSELEFGKRKAGLLTTSMEADVSAPAGPKGAKPKQTLALFRQQLIVQMADNQFIVLTFYTALNDRKVAAETFNAMLGAFEILDKTALDKRRLEAVKLAKSWLAQRTAEELKPKLIAQPQLFRMKVAGKDVGYIRFDELETERDGSKGVMLGATSRGWLVDENPALPVNERTKILKSQNIAYWAYSRDEKTKEERDGYSSWENSTATVVTRKDLPAGKYEFWVREAGILIEQRNTRLDQPTLDQLRKERDELLKRKDLAGFQIPPPIAGPQKQYHLIVNFTGDPTQAFQEAGKGVNVMIPEYRQAVLPKIMEYVWPRLVDLKKPSEMVFAVYNSATRKMTLRTLAVIGPDHIVLDGKLTDCVKCNDEMDNAGTTIWVDPAGRILKMLTSDQSLLETTTEDKMKRLWGDKPQG